MRDQLLLLGLAAILAGTGWLLWHFFAGDALTILLILGLTGAIAENRRLRKLLRSREQQ